MKKKILSALLMIALLLNLLPSTFVYAAQTSGINSNGVYNLINSNSNKYLNVHMGYDTNNTNVYQWTSDGSTEQKFKIVYDSTEDAYRIYAMCSSNGTNKVLDIVKSSGSVVSGCNVQIYNPVDNVAQLWKIVSLGNGKYKIVPKSNTNVALTAYGTSNGTSSGTASTSAGNVFVSTYTGAINQQWAFSVVPTQSSSYQYMFKSPYMATYISSGYGSRSDGFHYGIDITTGVAGAIKDYPVYSVLNGTLIKYGLFTDGITTCAAIKHSDGKTTRYIHMNLLSTYSQGNTVSTGVKIGTVSNQGCGPNNYHLHFDVNTINTYDGSKFTSSNTINPTELFPNIF